MATTTTYNTFELAEFTHRPISTCNPLVKSSRGRKFEDLPPELLHVILHFLTSRFKDLIQFSTLNRACKNVADHSLLWTTIELSFFLPSRFTMKFRAFYQTEFVISLDPITQYVIPTSNAVRVMHRNMDSLSHEFGTTNCYEVACLLRGKFMACMINYLKRADDYLIYYERANWIERLCTWNSENFIYFVEFSILWLFAGMYLLYDCRVNHLTVINHVGFFGIFYTLILYVTRFLLLASNSLAQHVMETGYLNQIFEGFNWKTISGSLINLVMGTGILFTVMLVYVKCWNSHSITYWYFTTIPLWISSAISVVILSFRNRSFCSNEEFTWGEVVIHLYLIIGTCITPILFALYFDDPIFHFGILNCGFILITTFPFLLIVSIASVTMMLYYLQALIMVGCLRCQDLTNSMVNKWWNNCIAVALLLTAIILTLLMNAAILGLCVSCFLLDNNTWDNKILNGLHFSPLVYALFAISTGTTLLLITFSIQDNTIVFPSR